MASKYWIKLYHEILDDPKMGTMPDHLWRRTIELFLIAGEYDQDGILPPVQQIAWKLRISIDECNETLQMLCDCNIIVTSENGDYTVKNFATRQGPSPESERTRRHREKRQAEKAKIEPKTRIEPKDEPEQVPEICNEDVTNCYDCNAPDIQITDINTSSKEDGEQPPPIPEKSKKAKKVKEKSPRASPTPAFKVYTEITGFYAVPTYWRNKIAQDVGESPENLEFWRKVVIGYCGKWSKANVEAMLEYFNRREIPSQARNGATSGQNKQQYPAPDNRPQPAGGAPPICDGLSKAFESIAQRAGHLPES